MSQAELARRVGVKRSAVTQWEHPLGTTPSMHHLIQIAIETGTCIEWLATARGPRAPGDTAGSTASINSDTRDPQEDEALLRFRRLPPHKRRIALQILQVLSG